MTDRHFKIIHDFLSLVDIQEMTVNEEDRQKLSNEVKQENQISWGGSPTPVNNPVNLGWRPVSGDQDGDNG